MTFTSKLEKGLYMNMLTESIAQFRTEFINWHWSSSHENFVQVYLAVISYVIPQYIQLQFTRK